jgi:hypothetical protein
MLDINFIGPPFDKTNCAVPTVFYFALSARDSLYLDPFNQPTIPLVKKNIRVCSITLPGHDTLSATDAMLFLASEMKKKVPIIENFIEKATTFITDLLNKEILIPQTTAFMGLSRGVLIAANIAAKIPQIPMLLAFAPLTQLKTLKEFQDLNTDLLNLNNLSQSLYNRSIRCYIGNNDTRVGTANCFEWIFQLAKTAATHQIRNIPIELIIKPSIGRDGHGTSPETFSEGSNWLYLQIQKNITC